jgi:hypothetical protein
MALNISIAKLCRYIRPAVAMPVRAFPCRTSATQSRRTYAMIKLGRVSKETRGPAVPGWVEDYIFNLDGNVLPKRPR